MPETIAAIATAVGEASIGVVRLSGPDALAIADALFRGARGRPLAQAPTFTVHYGWVVDPSSGAEVDEVLATVMRAPKSYTREDIVELSGHGGVVSVRRILDLVLAAGARLADPGEFTKRAFLNGRIDLAQAEAVLQIIRATHDAAHAATWQQLRGALSARLRTVRDQLLTVQAHLEVRVDFPEEAHPTWTPEQVQAALGALGQALDALITTAERGQARVHGCVTVLCGRPNVGKSLLLNALLQRDRAIVTPIPGTTRDTLEELCTVEGLPVRLVDTAGLADSEHPVELAGIQRSRAALATANVALWVLDRSEPLTPQDLAVAELVRDRPTLIVLNKVDLPPRLALDPVRAALPDAPILPVSARDRTGLPALEAQLAALIRQAHPPESHIPLVTHVRHLNALRQARDALRQAHAASAGGASPELLVVEIRDALDQLGLITGETVDDELLATIFSQFCIGK